MGVDAPLPPAPAPPPLTSPAAPTPFPRPARPGITHARHPRPLRLSRIFSSRRFSNAARYRSYPSLNARSTRDEKMSSPRGLVVGGMGGMTCRLEELEEGESEGDGGVEDEVEVDDLPLMGLAPGDALWLAGAGEADAERRARNGT